MFRIAERGLRAGERDGVDVERLPGAMLQHDAVLVRDAVTDAKPGQPGNLRERPQQDNLVVHRVADGRRRVVEELVVRLVEHAHDVHRQAVDELVERLVGDARAARVVRVGDEHQFGFRRDRLAHRVEVVRVQVAERHLDAFRLEHLRHDRVDDKCPVADDDLVARPDKGVVEELDDFVGAAAEDEVVHPDAELFRQRPAQVKPAAVGIEVRRFQRLPHGGDGFRRGAERVLVGRQFDDAARVESVFAGDFLDGPARFVDRHVANEMAGDGVVVHQPLALE